MVNDALAELGPDFEAIYALAGRPSIAPERLLRSSLPQILHSISSERPGSHRITVGADEGYDTQAFVAEL